MLFVPEVIRAARVALPCPGTVTEVEATLLHVREEDFTPQNHSFDKLARAAFFSATSMS